MKDNGHYLQQLLLVDLCTFLVGKSTLKQIQFLVLELNLMESCTHVLGCFMAQVEIYSKRIVLPHTSGFFFGWMLSCLSAVLCFL